MTDKELQQQLVDICYDYAVVNELDLRAACQFAIERALLEVPAKEPK